MTWWQPFFTSGTYTLLEELPAPLTELQVDVATQNLALVPGLRILLRSPDATGA